MHINDFDAFGTPEDRPDELYRSLMRNFLVDIGLNLNGITSEMIDELNKALQSAHGKSDQFIMSSPSMKDLANSLNK